jgi:hypothetical protein
VRRGRRRRGALWWQGALCGNPERGRLGLGREAERDGGRRGTSGGGGGALGVDGGG